ncbi:MAG: hypothetical protein NZM16_07065 [Thermoflexus sp.]|uniref:hypothetical protein n=2 Tax=Thermoflexus sp. TaxID=1969742 RepID=UPI0025EDD2B4|nr:hypothetical protein [Thermoflexus sp.]MCS6963788.1 hypothetical protein [Thermoflexus sp.]MDW8185593.1 hypothetical protein [Anaerolineae bacterium]
MRCRVSVRWAISMLIVTLLLMGAHPPIPASSPAPTAVPALLRPLPNPSSSLAQTIRASSPTPTPKAQGSGARSGQSGSPPRATPPAANPRYILFQFENNFRRGDHLFIYIDVDNNPETGFRVGGIGADYLVQDAFLFQRVRDSWKSRPCAMRAVLRAKASWRIPLRCLGNPPLGFRVIFERQDRSWAAVYTSPPLPVSGRTVAHKEQPPFVFFFYNNFEPGDHLLLYLDVDNNAGTGVGVNGLGIDYLIQDRWMFRWTGSWTAHTCPISATLGSRAAWQFPGACIGHPGLGFQVVFQRQNRDWAAVYTSGNVMVYTYTTTHVETAPTPSPAGPPSPPPPMFDITFQNNYQAGDKLRVYLNTDNNAGTGDLSFGGADYLVERIPDANFQAVYQWVGGTWAGVTCPSLTGSGASVVQWRFYATCVGSPVLPIGARFVRLDMNWNAVYDSGLVTINGYTVTHNE